MPTSSFLTPPDTDISIQYLTQLFGSGWQSLLNGGQTDGVTTLLGSMFTTFNVALMGFVVTLLVWQVTVGAMQTAHEGVTLGKRYHTIWAPMRAPFAIAMLTPLPLIKGLTILQALGMLAVSMSIGLADTVWNSFTGYAANNSGDLAISLSPGNSNDLLLNGVLQAETLRAAANASGIKTVLSYQEDGYKDSFVTYTYGFSQGDLFGGSSFAPNYGTISFGCGQDPGVFVAVGRAVDNFASFGLFKWAVNATTSASNDVTQTATCLASKNLVKNLYGNIAPIGDALIQQAQGKGSAPTNAQFVAAKTALIADAANVVNSNGNQQTKIHDQITAYSNTAQGFGWVSSTFYYPALTSMVGSYNELIDLAIPKSSQSNIAAIADNSGIPKADMNSYMSALSAYAATNGLSTTTNVTQDKTAWYQWLAKGLMGYSEDLQKGNLLVVLAAHGRSAIDVGLAIAAVSAVATTAGSAAKGVSPVGSFLGSLASQLGTIAGTIAAVLIVEGGILVFVLPSVPSFVMLFAVLGWIVLVMELFVALPLFAAAFAFAEGEGMAPQQTQHGIGVIGGILLRPVLLVFGFAFVFLLMNVAGHLLGMVFGALVMTFASSGGVGPVAYAFLLGILVTTASGIVYFVAKLMTHLAEYAPRWIGGSSGSDLGVGSEGSQVMKEGAGKGSAGAAAATGYMASSIGAAKKDAAQKDRDASQDAKIKSSADSVSDKTGDDKTSNAGVSGNEQGLPQKDQSSETRQEGVDGAPNDAPGGKPSAAKEDNVQATSSVDNDKEDKVQATSSVDNDKESSVQAAPSSDKVKEGNVQAAPPSDRGHTQAMPSSGQPTVRNPNIAIGRPPEEK